MESLYLKSEFINPLWYKKTSGNKYFCEVSHDETVIVEGEKLHFYKDKFPAGAKVVVFIGRNFECVLQSEYDKHIELRNLQIENEKQDRVNKKNELRLQAEEFNKSLNLPFKWDVGRKEVLSGLSENSWGNGRKKNTVEHIYLLEDYYDKRFSRKKGDFLCTSKSGNNGDNWSDHIIEKFYDGDNKEYQPKPSCRACLDIAKRLKDRNQESVPNKDHNSFVLTYTVKLHSHVKTFTARKIVQNEQHAENLARLMVSNSKNRNVSYSNFWLEDLNHNKIQRILPGRIKSIDLKSGPLDLNSKDLQRLDQSLERTNEINDEQSDDISTDLSNDVSR